jgi:hypothetical protein
MIEQAYGSGHSSHSFNNMGVDNRVRLTSVAGCRSLAIARTGDTRRRGSHEQVMCGGAGPVTLATKYAVPEVVT